MRITFLVLLFSLSTSLFANKPPSEIYQDLLKMKSLKRVLYIAAHPDDENTRALAYFSLGENAETAYLSLTRGDGGQNLIGDELSDALGVLRSQELLAARSHDKANQFFSRAVDFGYSKSADESFEKWGKELILADVVYVIRKFKPDVIVTRFPPDKRGGHGHHTASAMLAIEAFEKAKDPNYLPEQVEMFGTWDANAVYWNSSIWWDKEIDKKAKDNPKYIVEDIGGYNSLLGMSYNEIGTIARSQHKCQGFGAVIERGSRVEYFEHLTGKELNDFFSKNVREWKDVKGDSVEIELNKLIENFDFKNPEKNIVQLGKIRKALQSISDENLMWEKLDRIDKIIMDCAGLYIDVKAEDYALPAGDSVEVKINILNRSNSKIKFSAASKRNEKSTTIMNTTLEPNKFHESKIWIGPVSSLSNPYWLVNPYVNSFNISKEDIGKAEKKPIYTLHLNFSIDGVSVIKEVPVQHITRDPAYGERRRNVISVPKLTANFDQKLSIIKPGAEKKIKIKFHNFLDSLDTKVKVLAPEGWTIEPKEISISSRRKHEEIFQEITIKADKKSERGFLILSVGDQQLLSYQEIAYDHIPTQVIMKPSQIELIKLDAKIEEGKIAYIKGVKDAVPNGIRELGFEVDEYEVEDLSELDLSAYKAVVLGIRIYNVKPELKNFDQKLFDYVENGGKVIMQYNTASRWVRSKEYGPKPFKLGRKRVTEEDAEVEFLVKDHPILNSPNKIKKEDFENWVQERGLYFAETWDEAYTPLLSWHDKGEDPVLGGLIDLEYGKGHFIYTGISFFRELPNGVEGAFKLFANILSF